MIYVYILQLDHDGKQIEVMSPFILEKVEQNEPCSLSRWLKKVLHCKMMFTNNVIIKVNVITELAIAIATCY